MVTDNILYVTMGLVLSGIPFHNAIKYAKLNKQLFEIGDKIKSIENKMKSSNLSWAEKEQLLEKSLDLGAERHIIIEMMNGLL